MEPNLPTMTAVATLAAIREAVRPGNFWDRLDTATKTVSEVVRRVRALLAEHDDADVVELDVRLRLDPLEPATPGGCALTETIGGPPCIVIRDLVRVDELQLGHLVAMLLINAELNQTRPQLGIRHQRTPPAHAIVLPMTLVPEQPTESTDEALRLIGAIAVEATRLEWAITGMRRALEMEQSQQELLNVPYDRNVKTCLRIIKSREHWLDDEATEAVKTWLRSAKQLLKRRGDLMHSTWILAPDGDGTPYVHHLRSGSRLPLDLAPLRQLAEDLRESHALGAHSLLYVLLHQKPPPTPR